jgi:L-ornithine N5-oxygenase
VRVQILHLPTGVIDEIDCDAVIYATGFLPAPLRGILGDPFDNVEMDEGGRPVVSRDYRVATSTPTTGGLYIQGNTEHTHGLTSSLLSNIAIRYEEILQSILQSTHANRLGPARRELQSLGTLA